MGSHQDMDRGKRSRILEELTLKSQLMTELGKNRVQQGDIELEYEVEGLRVQKRADDPHGVIRVSIGGHPNIEKSSYCTVRGDLEQCIEIVERALFALKQHSSLTRKTRN